MSAPAAQRAPARGNSTSKEKRTMNGKKSGPINLRTILKTAGATGLMLATGMYAITARKH